MSELGMLANGGVVKIDHRNNRVEISFPLQDDSERKLTVVVRQDGRTISANISGLDSSLPPPGIQLVECPESNRLDVVTIGNFASQPLRQEV